MMYLPRGWKIQARNNKKREGSEDTRAGAVGARPCVMARIAGYVFRREEKWGKMDV